MGFQPLSFKPISDMLIIEDNSAGYNKVSQLSGIIQAQSNGNIFTDGSPIMTLGIIAKIKAL